MASLQLRVAKSKGGDDGSDDDDDDDNHDDHDDHDDDVMIIMMNYDYGYDYPIQRWS